VGKIVGVVDEFGRNPIPFFENSVHLLKAAELQEMVNKINGKLSISISALRYPFLSS
jgi:hypothetical protein